MYFKKNHGKKKGSLINNSVVSKEKSIIKRKEGNILRETNYTHR